jgi:alkanesulfonate monooxygenase SsuD/methylene tetrahydromethanopterin reductase-like flavin-dependent oxidoreductase (luciferase family)
MRFGVLMLPTDPWPEAVARAQHLEEIGYDHLWTYDHLTWRRYRDRPWYAATPWLTGIACATARVRLGTMVASPNFRHPVALAKDAVTLADISGGRFTLGIGAGGTTGFDATVFGAPLTGAARADRFAEFVELLDAVLHSETVTFSGEYYTTREALVLPRPDVPLAIAGGGPRSIALAARFGDAWITYVDSAPARAQSALLDEQCKAIGRDPSNVERVFLIGNTQARPLAGVAAFDEFVAEYEALGFTDIVFHDPRTDDPVWNEPRAIVDEIAAEVIPRRRG